MFKRLVIPSLLLSVMAGCGSASNHASSAPSTSSAASQTTAQTASTSAAATSSAATKPAAKVKVDTTYVAAQGKSKAPAVVIIPDPVKLAAADGEARRLASLGVAAMVVSPSAAPTQTGAFDGAVSATLAALKSLRARQGVDPSRVGIVGEGVGAQIGAVVIGRDPQAVAAAVLADVGGQVPSPALAPDRWLGRATGLELLLQSDQSERAMTPEQVKRLMLAAPPGTTLDQYKSLGTEAQAARDAWIKQKLLTT